MSNEKKGKWIFLIFLMNIKVWDKDWGIGLFVIRLDQYWDDAGLIFLAVCFATQLRPTSIEKEIFPKMAQGDNLFAFDLSGRYIST